MRHLLAVLLLVTSAWGEGTSTTFEWLPARATGGASTAWPATNALRCVEVVPQLTITATQMAWFVSGGLGGGGACSFTIYTANGSSQIATSGSNDCSTTGKVLVTGLTPFTLTAGVKVQICTCANTNGGGYLSAASATAIITTMQNALATPVGTSAANSCVSNAVPPASTGVLTATAVNAPILLVAATGF